jgi:hypothetical protein
VVALIHHDQAIITLVTWGKGFGQGEKLWDRFADSQAVRLLRELQREAQMGILLAQSGTFLPSLLELPEKVSDLIWRQRWLGHGRGFLRPSDLI